MREKLLPNEKQFDGPWLFKKSDLKDLNETLNKIGEKLKEYKIRREFNKELKDNENISEESKERLIKEIKENIYFKKEIIVSFKNSNTKNKYDDIEKMFKDIDLENKLITGIEGSIKCLKEDFFFPKINDFNFEISRKNIDESLNYKIGSPLQEKKEDIIYIFEKWIRKARPNIIIRLWKKIIGLHWFFLFAIFPIIMLFKTTKTDLYIEKLNNEAKEILDKGINENSMNKAIELILRYNSEYRPEEFARSFDIFNIAYMLLFFLVLGLIIHIAPTTNFDIGKGEIRIKFWNIWLTILGVIIPLYVIIPIIIAIIL